MSDPIWPTYQAPKSHVSALVQMPSYLIDGYSLADAYMRDERARAAARKAETPKGENDDA